MKSLLVLGLLVSGAVSAQVEYSLDDEIQMANEAINAPAINIEGQYQVPTPPPAPVAPVAVIPQVTQRAPLSMSERMRLRRAKLEERNRIMMEKKMEQIRMQQEIALTKQIEKQMNNALKAIGDIQ